MVRKAQVVALTAGDSWFEKGTNLLLFGPPGGASDAADIYFGVVRYEEEFRQVVHSDPAEIPKTRKWSLHC
jgi:hypothetical protein